MPAAFTIATQAAASNFVGLKAVGKSRSYSGTVMRLLCITHSPSPATAYTPQWTNRPKRASWNQARAFRFSGAGV